MDISDVPLYVENIIIEPKSTSQQFVIYGSYSYDNEEDSGDFGDKNKPEDVMITLDFSGLHEPKCKGIDTPGKEGSDFELWSPHDDGRHGSADKCFLGQQVTYVRRKQDSECYNGEDMERQIMRQSCICTQADYECDVNYIMSKSGKCEPIADPLNRHSNLAAQDKADDCAAEGFYYVTKGYRKIPGNQCYGGVQLDPHRNPCTSMGWFFYFINLKSILVTGLILGVLYYGWPILEAIILILPLPDPKDAVDRLNFFVKEGPGMLMGMIFSLIMSTSSENPQRSGYTANLEAPIDNFIDGEEEDSDDENDVGSIRKELKYDDGDEEQFAINTNASNELIDLGSTNTTATG